MFGRLLPRHRKLQSSPCHTHRAYEAWRELRCNVIVLVLWDVLGFWEKVVIGFSATEPPILYSWTRLWPVVRKGFERKDKIKIEISCRIVVFHY